MRLADFAQGTSAHNNGVCRGAQQPHDETVFTVRPADIAAAGFSGDRETDYAIERADEVSDHVWPSAARARKAKISSVECAESLWQHGWTGRLLPVQQRANLPHR